MECFPGSRCTAVRTHMDDRLLESLLQQHAFPAHSSRAVSRLAPRPAGCREHPQLLLLSITDPPYAKGSTPVLQYQPQSCFLIAWIICGCSGFHGALTPTAPWC